MKIKAPFRFETFQVQREKELTDAGYMPTQYIFHKQPKGKRCRWHRWWLWSYVQAENRLLRPSEMR